MGGRRRRVDEIPAEQFAVVGANIRTLRLRKGWTQAKLGELMGWPTTAHRVRGRRPPRWPATRIHSRGGAAAGRHLRDLLMAAHDALRELQRAPAGWIRLPDMRGPSLDMKPPSAGLAEKTYGRNRCGLKCSW